MPNPARARVPLVMFVVLVLQASLLSAMNLGNVRPDAMLLLPIAAGIVAGSEPGAVVGFVAGLVADLFLQTPLGLSALSYSLIGFGVGAVQSSVLRAAWWIPMLTAMAASAAGVIVFAVMGAMVGQAQLVRPNLPVIVTGVAVINGPLGIAVVRMMSWAWKAERGTQVFAR